MATTLKAIIHFANVASGATASLPHGLNVNGLAVIPDVYAPSSTEPFTVAIDDTNVTVTNVGPDAGDIDVLVEYWHTFERAFGAAATKVLTPRPFALAGAVAPQGVSYPTLRVLDPGAANRPTIAAVGASFAYICAVGNRVYFEVPLHPLLDRTKDIIIGVSWAPGGSQAGRLLSWQINVLPCEIGSNLAGAGTAYNVVDDPVPDTIAIYTRSSIVVPAAAIANQYDELHVRVQRVASSNDPAADPAIHHVAVIQQLTTQ